MKQVLLSLFFLAAWQPTFAQEKSKNVERPKLVVGIVIDQMRWDYLYRYYSEYGDDGFKRLLGKGFSCQNTFINYLPAFTAPGHTCIYTGSVPSIHGIAGNNWIDNSTKRAWYCTDDDSVTPIGGSVAAGKMSPRNLLTTTITDELRLATNNRSKVFGIALKDRGAILPAGHLANGAFWFDDSTGNFMSSSYYYRNSLPDWLKIFNGKRFADSLIAQPWNLLYPQSYYKESIADDNNYEGIYKNEKRPVFPHIAAPSKEYSGLRKLPGGNTISFNMAKACIAGEQLGQTGNTDFLTLSISSTDYMGHNYAPNSLEAEDMYLRLDKEIASFLSYLDEKIGKGEYVLFLSADHGAAHNPAYLTDKNVPAGNQPFEWVGAELNTMIKKQFGTDSLIVSLENYQVYLDEVKIQNSKIDRAALKTAICTYLKKMDNIEYVVDMEHLDYVAIPEPIRMRIVNGYYAKRSGAIQFIMNPAWFSGYTVTGTTHGSWNPYDTHIPLVWYGWHIPHGERFKEVYMTDISATLAAMLHIQMPNGCIGKVIDFK